MVPWVLVLAGHVPLRCIPFVPVVQGRTRTVYITWKPWARISNDWNSNRERTPRTSIFEVQNVRDSPQSCRLDSD
ncbi:hypothetical protein BDR03DRAFT_962782, partial [Suillus americanus]